MSKSNIKYLDANKSLNLLNWLYSDFRQYFNEREICILKSLSRIKIIGLSKYQLISKHGNKNFFLEILSSTSIKTSTYDF